MLETHIVIAERVKELAAKRDRFIDYIEIGVSTGNSAKAVFETGVCRHATLIDNWTYEGASKEKSEAALAAYADKIRMITGDSQLAIKYVVGLFDVGYVDGDHTEKGNVADMENMLPLIRSVGVMFVDDLDHPQHRFLHAATEKFAKKHNLHMIFHDSLNGLAELSRL